MKLYLDTETRSDVNLKKHGLYRYTQGKKFDVILLSWAIDDEPPHVWDIANTGYKAIPKRLASALTNPKTEFLIHNSGFDRTVMAVKKLANIPVERTVDTMVMALAHGLPASLDMLGKALGLPDEMTKMDEGRRLIRLFCNVRKDGWFNNINTHPEDWALFKQYALMDIVAMRECYKRMPKANYPTLEHRFWQIDQKINARGIPVDVEFAEAAVREAEVEKETLDVLTVDLTKGAVARTTQRDKFKEYLKERFGIDMPDMQAPTIERRLMDPELPLAARTLLETRVQASQNAAAKYQTILNHHDGGRIKNTLQMYGASRTGRDAGRVFQPQNLKRPTMWHGRDGAELDAAIEEDVVAIKGGIVTFVHPGKVMEVLGNCVRSVIRAPEGKKLVQADLSNIEGRGLVWLSDETWKIQFFYDFDSGKIKFDNYVAAYSRAMGVPPEEVDRDRRNIGKVMELGLGYGGGVAAFLQFVDVYGLDLKELARSVHSTADHTMAECVAKYDWAVENKYHAGLEQFEYAACEYLKTKWREAHPKTVKFWSDLEQAFRNAINFRNKSFWVGRLEFRRHGGWLTIKLPSGRRLVYANPKVDEDGQLSFMGVDGYTKKWQRIKTYSGKLAENVTSATARDVLIHRLPDIEAAGYEVIMRVHDEFVTEAPDTDEYSSDELARLMAMPHEWTPGFPLAAAGFEAKRYRKD